MDKKILEIIDKYIIIVCGAYADSNYEINDETNEIIYYAGESEYLSISIPEFLNKVDLFLGKKRV